MKSAADAACGDWDYPRPDDTWFAEVRARLPIGLRTSVGEGFEAGLLSMADGFRFTMRDLAPGKGPYALFSRSQRKVLAVNWEYVVQASDYIRVHRCVEPAGLVVGVEDHLMDVTVRDTAGALLWYVESKERASDASRLIDGVREWGATGVDYEVNDRGKDSLRKAKLLVEHRSTFFSVSAIGGRWDFSVQYREGARFILVDDVVPFG